MQPRVLVLTLLAPLGAWCQSVEAINSAEVCGSCHRAIHEAWKQSAHARAMENRLFQDALQLAQEDFGVGSRKLCLSCHSPMALHTGDLLLQKKASWEGVTCDYCHSLREVSLAGPNPKALLEFSRVKSGPLKTASPAAHGAVHSEVHSSSRACASCHEYRNAFGFPVLTTFSEWKQSRSAKEGRQCQSCHMYRVAGDVVDPRVQRSSMAKVNLHQMPGSRSLDQLNRTIRVNLSTSRESDQMRVNVEMTNRTAGHFVPTGSPLRQLLLELRADSYDGQHFREERTYRRTIADEQGTVLEREHLAVWKGAKVVSDTRLAPDEKRIETFSFPIPAGVQTQVKLTLCYYYSPMARTESQQRVVFRTISRLVK